MDRDFVINIILKARDEIAGVVAKAAAEIQSMDKAAGGSGLGKLNKDAERLADTVRNKVVKAMGDLRGEVGDLGNDVERLEGKFGKLSKEAEETNRKLNATDLGKLQRELKGAAQEVESLEQKLKRTDPGLYRREYDQLGQALEKARAKYSGISSEVQEYGKNLDDLSRINSDLNKTTNEHTKALDRAEAAYQKQAKAVAKMKVERDKLAHSTSADKIDFAALDEKIVREKAKLYKLATEVELLNAMGVNIDVDLQTKGFDEHALQVEIEKKALGRTVHVPVEADLGRFIAEITAAEAAKQRLGRAPGGGAGDGGGFLSWFKELDRQASKNSHSIAAFDNSLRGLAVLAIVATAQQLLTVVTALGGELVQLAGSATMAGSALGGALAAGASQALPVVGLLVASIARVASVIQAVKQSETLAEQQSYRGGKEENQTLGAKEGVVNATEAVTSARENLREAELNLTKARFDARRELQDLIMTEKQAELAARGATLSQIESNLALRKAMATGSITDFAQAQISAEESRLGTQEANTDLSRARQDLRFQERGSPLRPDTGVRDAERQVEQSRKSLVQAERSAKAAKRSLDEAVTGGSAAAGKLNFMLAELDESEKRLYRDAKKLYATYKEVMRPITDVIVNSFDYATRKGIGILRNPKFQSAFKELADSMGSNFKRVVDLFSSPRTTRFFEIMTKDAAKNIGPLTDALISFAETWMNISEAAAPVLEDIVGWIAQGADEFKRWVGQGKPLEEFFREGEHMLEAWFGLTRALIDLFLALVGASAKQGTEQVEALTGSIQKATEWIQDHQERVEEFFHDVGEVMSALGEVVLALGAEILKSFNVENTKALADFIIRILIPALGSAIRFFGEMVKIIDDISKTPAGEFILRFGAMVLILKTVLSPIAQSMLALVGSASKFANFMAAGIGYLMGIPKATMEAQGPLRALSNQMGLTTPRATTVGEYSTGTTPGSTTARRGGIRGVLGKGMPSSLSQLGARAGAGLGIASIGLTAGTMIGGPAGKYIDYASIGAGLGMFAGPEGAAIGAGIGLAAAAVMELMQSEKKLSTVQKHLNDLADAYPDLLENAEGAISNLTASEEELRDSKSKVRSTAATIRDLEKELNHLRENGAGPKAIKQAEEELTTARKENNTALREKRRLEEATPREKEVVFASTTRALSNVTLRRKAEERHLARVNRQIDEEGITPELEDKFNAATKQVRKFKDESERLSGVLRRLGPAGADAAKKINRSWAVAEFGLKGKGLIKSIEAARDEITKLREMPKTVVTERQIQEAEDRIDHFRRVYEKHFGKIRDYIKDKWRKEIVDALKLKLTVPQIRKVLREGAGNESAEARAAEMYRAQGGPIGSGYGGGDRVHVAAEEGEHVITKEEVRRAGGHGVIFAMRRMLGGGTQASGGRYAAGGAVSGSSGGGGISLEAVLEAIQNFGGSALSYWNGLWDSIEGRTDQGTHAIERDMGRMEKALIQSSKRTNNQVVKAFNNLFGDVRSDINQLTHVVYQGLSYVAEVTEKALQGFGVQKINLSIPKPKGAGQGGGKGSESKAGGGFVGLMGERGGDFVNTWLGRGEAVLNWGHQKLVEPAMRAYHGFGLNEMFRSTRTEHAGGGMGGFAKGRAGLSSAELFDGHPSNVASSLRKLIEIMKGKWPGLLVASTTDHSLMTSSGNVSDHSTGHAVDLASGDYGLMNKAARWVLSSGLYKQIKQGIHNPNLAVNDGVAEDPPGIYAGGVWDEHADHIHLAVFDALKGAFGGAGITKLKKMVVKGTQGAMKAIAQGAMNKVVNAANKFIRSKMGMGVEPHSGKDVQFGGKLPPFLEKYNHVYAEHNSADGDWGGPKMPFNDIAALAEWAGLPGITFAQITKGESAQRPGATGIDPGGTKGLGLWMITTGFNDELIARLGGEKAMLNPIINAKAAAEIYKSSGIGAWYGTDFVTGTDLHYNGSFAKGGVIQALLNGIGGSGAGVPILAHIGEWILNTRQQNKLAKLLGVSVDKLKGMLGFSGGPKSFAGGGEKKAEGGKEDKGPSIGIDDAERLTALPIPDLEHFSTAIKHYLEGVNKELKRGEDGITKKRKNLLKFMTTLFANLEAEQGEFQEGWEQIQRTLAIGFAKAGVRLSKSGKILGAKMSPQELLNFEIKNLYKELGFLLNQNGPILKSLRLAQKAFRKARKEGSLKGEEMAQKAIVTFRSMLRDNELSVAEARKNILEKQMQRENENVAKISEHAESRLGSAFSKDEAFAAYAEEEEKLNAALRKAKKTRNTELVKQIEEEKRQIEAGRVESINKQAEAGLNFRTSRASIASAMGFSAAAATWNSYTIDVFRQQSSELQGALNSARASGNAALAGQIEQELQNIEVSIAEATAAMFQASIEQVEKRFSHETALRSMYERISQARSVFGNAPQLAEQKQQFLLQERNSQYAQLSETQRLLSEAIGKGFGPDVTEPLEEKIWDLTGQLAENEAALYSNTVAIRQAYIDQIQERSGFEGGVFKTLENIVTGLGGLSGVVNQAKLIELIKAQGNLLGGAGWELRGQLGAFSNERLGGGLNYLLGLHGEELVAAIQSLDFRGIENFLGPGSEASKQFQALINAILENEVAVIENTKQLEEAMKENQIQSFTSTAWQWFRKAIFTGMGGLMPNYAEGTPYYSAAEGGEVGADGPFNLHRGELIIPNNYSTILRSLARASHLASSFSAGSYPQPMGLGVGAGSLSAMASNGMASEVSALREELARRTQNVETNVYEAEPSDPTYLSNRIAFAVKNPAT